MPLLADYAITPDVFDVTSYSTADECAVRIETISNVIGIVLPYGFEEGGGDTTWTMLDQNDRDAVQREFDRAAKQRTLARYFEIPGRRPGREPRRGRMHHA